MVRFGQFIFENELLDEPKKIPSSRTFYLLRMMVKNAKWWSKSNLPLFLSAKFFPLIKGFFNYPMYGLGVAQQVIYKKLLIILEGFTYSPSNFSYTDCTTGRAQSNLARQLNAASTLILKNKSLLLLALLSATGAAQHSSMSNSDDPSLLIYACAHES